MQYDNLTKNNKKIINIYLDHKSCNYKMFPRELNNKESLLTVIKHLYDVDIITKDNLTKTFLIKECKLSCTTMRDLITIDKVYNFLFGDSPKNYPWLYKNYKLYNLKSKQAKKIFFNYIKENNVLIENIYEFDYWGIIKKCKIANYCNGKYLAFVMHLYDNELPAYKFNISTLNYWRNRQHRIQAMKYLIEKDMKLDINKIPLYISKLKLRKHSNTLYHVLKKYYKTLWEWINECYPNMYIPEDFNETIIKNEFNSMDEAMIHDVLVDNLSNVLYNNKKINIYNMIPDWFVLSKKSTYIIEYFGGYLPNSKGSRDIFYVKSTHKKLKKYKNIRGYKTIFIYPEDLKDNMKGLHEKIKEIE